MSVTALYLKSRAHSRLSLSLLLNVTDSLLPMSTGQRLTVKGYVASLSLTVAVAEPQINSYSWCSTLTPLLLLQQ